MAWDAASSNSGRRTPIFPNRLKSFVGDVSQLKRKRSLLHEANARAAAAADQILDTGEGAIDADQQIPTTTHAHSSTTPGPHQISTAVEATTPTTTSEPHSRQILGFGQEASVDPDPGPVPVLDQRLEIPGPQPTTVIDTRLPAEQNLQLKTAGDLTVHIALTFHHPLDFSYSRSYSCSPRFVASERLCRGLLRRIDHSAFELVTRKDCYASSPIRSDGITKTQKYEMKFNICKNGVPWASRTYKSHQKEPMTTDGAKEVIFSSHRIVGLFLRRHDPEFVWKDGPVRDEPPQGAETSTYRAGGLQPMNCVPRSQFLEKQQQFEMTPGFTLEMSLTSRSKYRQPSNWQKSIQICSCQTTPLNLAVAETLFSDISSALEIALRSKKQTIQEQHHSRCGFIGGNCQHYEDDAFEVDLRVKNNLGPQFDHLERTIRSKVAIISQPESQDCLNFLNTVEKSLQDARDTADGSITLMNDLDFRILELRGRGWTLDEPLIFTLGPGKAYSRRSVEAILDRIQAGVADSLRSNAVTVRMSATKRGHFILDKTLVARDSSGKGGGTPKRWYTPSKNKAKVVDRLRRRIEQDIQMICRETCSLDDLDDEPRTGQAISAQLAEQSEDTNPTKSDTPGIPFSETRRGEVAAEVEADVHNSLGSESNNIIESKEDYSEEIMTRIPEEEEYSEGVPSPTSLRDPKSGIRFFPLVPSPTSHAYTGLFDSAVTGDSNGQQTPLAQSGNATGTADLRDEMGTNLGNGSETKTVDSYKMPDDGLARKDGSIFSGTQYQKLDDPESKTNHDENHEAQQLGDMHMDLVDDNSTAPSTPGMTFESGQSARSSLMYTPKIQGSMSSSDVELLMNDNGGHDDRADVDVYQKFLKITPVDAPNLLLARYRRNPSPLHQDVVAKNQSHITPSATLSRVTEQSNHATDFQSQVASRDTEGLITDSTLIPAGLSVQPPSERNFSHDRTGQNNSDSDEGTVTQQSNDQHPFPQESHTKFNNAFITPPPEFAQSREDFDFSSPFTTTSTFSEDPYFAPIDESIEESNGGTPTDTQKTLANQDSLEDINMAPPSHDPIQPGLTRAARKSFGSAGLIGFHPEQRIGVVGLRRALMASRSSSPSKGVEGLVRRPASPAGRRPTATTSEPSTPPRPSTSAGALVFSKSPEQRISKSLMERSSSSSLLPATLKEAERVDRGRS